MADDSNPDVFKKVDSIIKRDQTRTEPALRDESPITAITKQADEISQKKLDLIGKFKGSAINRKAALEQLRKLHEAHLEAAAHALKQAVAVDKARVDTIANRYIFQVNEAFLEDMRVLGLQNVESRAQTNLELNNKMAALLRQAQAQDVPDSFKNQTIENICRMYKEFSDKLMEEGFKLS